MISSTSTFPVDLGDGGAGGSRGRRSRLRFPMAYIRAPLGSKSKTFTFELFALLLNSMARKPLDSNVAKGDLGSETYRLARDPANIKGRRHKIGDASVKKELAFNTYIQQIEEPRSFLNLLPEGMKENILSIPQELVGKDEDEILEILKETYRYVPTASVEAMRNNFWMEHDRVITTRNEIMNQSNVYLGVVSRQQFHDIVNTAPHVMAYIITRPPEYEAVMRGLLNLSTRKIRDVLNLPLRKADGSVQDAKIIELVLKAAAMVDLRAKGGYVQRSETKNLTLMKQENSYTNVFQAASSTKSMDISKLTGDIDAKIAALEKEMQAVPGIAHQPSEATDPVVSVDATFTAEYKVVKDGEIV